MSLDFLKKQTGVEETTQDRIGGGSFTIDSGVYPAVLKKAYLVHSSSSKAVGVALEIQVNGDKEYRETVYVTNGEGNNTYIDKKTSKPKYLPGFELVSNLVSVINGKELSELVPEEKVVELYNAELKRKAPTSVQMFTELLEAEFVICLQKVKSFKQAKDAATGKYVDTPDVREGNEIVNVFNTAGFTALELKAKATEINFINECTKVYTAEYIKDATKGKTPTATAGANNLPPVNTPSLFGNAAK